LGTIFVNDKMQTAVPAIFAVVTSSEWCTVILAMGDGASAAAMND
jgi:thioredoxin reductase